jgi:hypothetical protein
VEGYELLIISFNHALRALRKINVPPLRESTDLLPLFQRNDLKLMTATLNGRTLQCTPYIILASLADTRAAYSRGDQSDEWADYAFKIAAKAPQKDLSSSYLSVAEFKKSKSPLPAPEQGLWATHRLRYRRSTIPTETRAVQCNSRRSGQELNC